MDADDLTPVAQDYLKVIWSAVEWGEPPITTKALAERFATSQANVSGTMRRLQAQGLVTYEPYRPVVLTDLGERLAVGMVRRHRLIETFLAQVLGYGWEEVHDDAERLEHAASERFLARIDAILDHPRTDPHGDPIPTADGRWVPQSDALRLADAGPGGYRVSRVDDSDPDLLGRLRRLLITPGATLWVSEGTPGYRRADGTPLDLGTDALAAIRVRPERGPAAGPGPVPH
ncbi:MAG: metal-dependent transcriptional regulator [Propionibacteriaceae bacterium]|nr:metal-dependent transcriptional regulator [Propionibacteriaceae bacterium]